MAEGVNVRFAGELNRFIQSRTSGDRSLYASASEYIRALVRRDYEHEERRKLQALRDELKHGAGAGEAEFIPLVAGDIIARAKARKKNVSHGR